MARCRMYCSVDYQIRTKKKAVIEGKTACFGQHDVRLRSEEFGTGLLKVWLADDKCHEYHSICKQSSLPGR